MLNITLKMAFGLALPLHVHLFMCTPILLPKKRLFQSNQLVHLSTI